MPTLELSFVRGVVILLPATIEKLTIGSIICFLHETSFVFETVATKVHAVWIVIKLVFFFFISSIANSSRVIYSRPFVIGLNAYNRLFVSFVAPGLETVRRHINKIQLLFNSQLYIIYTRVGNLIFFLFYSFIFIFSFSITNEDLFFTTFSQSENFNIW